jgi:hypothetical protein
LKAQNQTTFSCNEGSVRLFPRELRSLPFYGIRRRALIDVDPQ